MKKGAFFGGGGGGGEETQHAVDTEKKTLCKAEVDFRSQKIQSLLQG